VVEEIKKLLCKADTGNSKEARAMVEKVAKEFGHLDILVKNQVLPATLCFPE
jgi:hypothetical protein